MDRFLRYLVASADSSPSAGTGALRFRDGGGDEDGSVTSVEDVCGGGLSSNDRSAGCLAEERVSLRDMGMTLTALMGHNIQSSWTKIAVGMGLENGVDWEGIQSTD